MNDATDPVNGSHSFRKDSSKPELYSYTNFNGPYHVKKCSLSQAIWDRCHQFSAVALCGMKD